MSRVLTIDIDYIWHNVTDNSFIPQIDTIKKYQRYEELPDNYTYASIDQGNLLYIWEVYTRALEVCSNVVFCHYHDAILYELEKYSKIDLINIDQHHDIFYHMEELPEINIDEGNWIIWLCQQDLLNTYTWIKNEDSEDFEYNEDLKKIVPGVDSWLYHPILRTDYTFTNYKFDYINVCLSPTNMSETQWHYFDMFHIAYKNYYRKEPTIIGEGYGRCDA